MDIAGDADFILQRSAPQLLSEFKALLPRFLRKILFGPGDAPQTTLRRHVKDAAVQRMIRLLEPFQEWPQLLDPHLQSVVVPLTGTFLDCIESEKDLSNLHCSTQESSMSLFRAASRILYTLCKIRGPTFIGGFYSSEPRHLETMLCVLEASSKTPASQSSLDRSVLGWEEKYILLLWLGHLALAPFDLNTIGRSAAQHEGTVVAGIYLPQESPALATRLIKAAVENLSSAGKDREAAVSLLVRVVLRPDMRRLGLHEKVLRWTLDSLSADYQLEATDSVYRTISLLDFTAGLVKAADVEVVRPFLLFVFGALQRLEEAQTRRAIELRGSALARKAIIKIFRGVSIAAVQSDLSTEQAEDCIAGRLLDDVMGHLLESLADSDTLVRFAASKAISALTSKLGPAMTADVSEAILEGLRDNVLPGNRRRVAVHLPKDGAAASIDTIQDRSLAAVNNLRWHGLVLSLSQLLYRRAPPVDQLDDILDALLLALAFEQRSSTGASLGATVRDAACFGIWAVARKYATHELSGIQLSVAKGQTRHASTLQILANQLMATAVCDISGNIRRGASAALQELVGRHPDTIFEGIKLVQIVDYHAVALRARALQQVAPETAKLSPQYWEAIVDELLAWRGIDAVSVDARRLAAGSLGLLATAEGTVGVELLADALLHSYGSLGSQSVERRHGHVLAAAAGARAWESLGAKNGDNQISSQVLQMWQLVADVPPDDITTKIRKADLTIEAICTLMPALTSLRVQGQGSMPQGLDTHCMLLLQHCLAHRGPVDTTCVTVAAKELFLASSETNRGIVLEHWLLEASRGRNSNHESHGHLRALGAAYRTGPCSETDKRRILDTVLAVLRTDPTIETKIAALHGLRSIVTSGRKQPLIWQHHDANSDEEVVDQSVLDALIKCLGDHTTDQRGDVGSQVRMAAVEVVRVALKSGSIPSSEMIASLSSKVYVLAGEKLDRCRLQARTCLSELLAKVADSEPTDKRQPQPSSWALDAISVSSCEYFVGLLSTASHRGLLHHLLEGLATSIGAGSESVMVASRSALSKFLGSSNLEQQALFISELHMLLRLHQEGERLSIPILETLAYALRLIPASKIDETSVPWRKIFLLVQRVHYKSGNISKLTAAIDIYSELASVAAIRREVLLKLTSMLRHPFPKIRNHAADALFTCSHNKKLCELDWSISPAKLRRHIDDLQSV